MIPAHVCMRKPALALFVMAAVLSAVSICAQMEKSLMFIPGEVDFGKIREDDGKVSRIVKAVNISSDTTFIISSRTGCGCSAAEFSDDPIAPGDTADILVSYDPRNRPGRFLKTAKIYTGAERIPNSFKLRGLVIPGQRSLDMAYPEQAGALRLSARVINAGDMTASEARPLFVGIYNGSSDSLTLSAVTDSDALEGAFAPDSVEPFGVSSLTLMLRARELNPSISDFSLNAYILNAATGDTLVRIPVGGHVERRLNLK